MIYERFFFDQMRIAIEANVIQEGTHLQPFAIQRINKMKLDNPNFKTADKVNISSARVDTMPISEHSRLHKNINDSCAGKMPDALITGSWTVSLLPCWSFAVLRVLRPVNLI